jgi:hypothetical protein
MVSRLTRKPLQYMSLMPQDSQFPKSISAGREPKYFPTIEAVQQSLDSIPVWAPNMRWDENDPPASDILGARLRAKFYGAQNITYRHFVLKILDHSASKGNNMPSDTVNTEFVDGIQVPNIIKGVKGMEGIDSKVLEYASLCIKALINSTTAFHGLGDPGSDRLIVTNIWGTAHAYDSPSPYPKLRALTNKVQTMGQFARPSSRIQGSYFEAVHRRKITVRSPSQNNCFY